MNFTMIIMRFVSNSFEFERVKKSVVYFILSYLIYYLYRRQLITPTREKR